MSSSSKGKRAKKPAAPQKHTDKDKGDWQARSYDTEAGQAKLNPQIKKASSTGKRRASHGRAA